MTLFSDLAEDKSYILFERLFTVAMCLSPSNCDCERGFGLVSFLQNKWGNSLKMGGLNSLMHIKLNTESWTQVRIDKVYNVWLNKEFKSYVKLLDGKHEEDEVKENIDFEEENETYDDAGSDEGETLCE